MKHINKAAALLAPSHTGLRLVSTRAAPLAAAKAQEIVITRAASAEDAAAAIMMNALDQFTANKSVLEAQDAPERVRHEAVHQMRVALRRLRATIALFRSVIDGSALENAQTCAKSIAAVLGEARDWDIFRQMVAAGPLAAWRRASNPGEAHLDAFLHAIDQRRAEARAKIGAALTMRETINFVADLRRTILTRDWSATENARQKGSARRFAAEALTRLHKRAVKRRRGLATLSPEDRHQARIALKKARYASEFFHSLFSSKTKARAFSGALANLQDRLGVSNDLETANYLLDALEAAADVDRGSTAFVRGWVAHAAYSGVADTKKSDKTLRALRPFWR